MNKTYIITILSLIMIMITSYINVETYYDLNPYCYDPLGNYVTGVEIFNSLQEHSITKVISNVFLEDEKHPLVMVVPAIFPKLYLTKYAHLLLLAPLLFLLVISWFKFTGKVSLQNSLPLLFYFTANLNLSYYFGWASFTNDVIPGISFAIATCFYLMWHYDKSSKAIYWFALFSAISILSRNVFAVYIIITFFVPVVIKIIQSKDKKKVLFALGKMSLVILIIAGLVVFYHFQNNVNYYTKYNGANSATLGAGIAESIKDLSMSLLGFMGKIHLLLFLIIMAYILFQKSFRSQFSFQNTLVYISICFGVCIFWVFSLGVKQSVSGGFIAVFPTLILFSFYYFISTQNIPKPLILSAFVIMFMSVGFNQWKMKNTIVQNQDTDGLNTFTAFKEIVLKNNFHDIAVFSNQTEAYRMSEALLFELKKEHDYTIRVIKLDTNEFVPENTPYITTHGTNEQAFLSTGKMSSTPLFLCK